MKAWALDVTKKILASMRYCYLPMPETTNEEEWIGEAEAGGARDFVLSLFYDQRKKCFIQGYLKGSLSAWQSSGYPKEDLTFELAAAKVGAERAWQEFDKE